MRAHIDHAFQAELGANCRGGHAMLACACFRDDARLAHAAGEDDLAQHVVDLVRAGMVQLVPLEINLGPAQMLRQPVSVIKRAGASHIMGPQIMHFSPKTVVGLGVLVLLFQLEDKRHQRLGNEASAIIAKAALFIGPGHEAVEKIVHIAGLSVMRTSAMNMGRAPGFPAKRRDAGQSSARFNPVWVAAKPRDS